MGRNFFPKIIQNPRISVMNAGLLSRGEITWLRIRLPPPQKKTVSAPGERKNRVQILMCNIYYVDKKNFIL